MGWSSAGPLVQTIIEGAKLSIPDEDARRMFYGPVIAALEDQDWDTQDEVLGEDPAFDAALKELHPEWDCWDG